MTSNDNQTIFATALQWFPDEKINEITSVNFLNIARTVVNFIDKLGRTFSPLKYDMNGNIEKIHKTYLNDPGKNEVLQTMILTERDDGGNIATDALMWLRRGLHFFQVFIDSLTEECGLKPDEDLSVCLRHSYTITLKPYHGWMAQRLFSLLCKLSPKRSEMIALMSEKAESTETKETPPELIAEMRTFNNRLKQLIDELLLFYNTNQLENDAQV